MVAEQEIPSFTARLLIDCADRPGIVAAVSGFLFEQGANIVSSHQYSSDPTDGRFYLRTEFILEGLGAVWPASGTRIEQPAAGQPAREHRERFERDFAERVARPFEMDWKIRYWGQRQRMAILVSRYDHCLFDLLWRSRRRELDAEIACVISNHPDLRPEVDAAGIPYHHVPIPPAGKPQAEETMLELLAGKVDLVVLARYMQILSGDFLDRLGVPVINIHHSFLPAFAGAEPYRRAREHGVKLIGATAHYVVAELDAGPIIDQDVARVDHHHTVADLERIGRDIERVVFSRAVALHLDDRVIADAGRTIVF